MTNDTAKTINQKNLVLSPDIFDNLTMNYKHFLPENAGITMNDNSTLVKLIITRGVTPNQMQMV